MRRSTFDCLSIIPAAIIVGGLIIGCSSSTPDPTPAPEGYGHLDVINHYGKHVFCINGGGSGAINCDWDHPW